MVPSLFIAHGAPLLAIQNDAYSAFLGGLAAKLPLPKAIVLFSAHWESPLQQVSSAGQYEMIYDFFGFPEEMYGIRYPAKGHRELAETIKILLEQHGVPCSTDAARGLDHGAWVVLKLLYPAAEIPVVAMSVHPGLVPEEQYRIGKALTSLRGEDVLVIGSGGTVHNLRRVNWNQATPDSWAVQFDEWLGNHMEQWDLDSLFDYDQRAPFAAEAVPSAEHFVPLFIAMGAADDAKTAQLLHRSYQYGSLSLSCWQFG